jgi:hypothetical protein
MPIGFGKALEIRKDPNADRGKWVEPVINNIKETFQHPIESMEKGPLGEATRSPEGLMNLLFGLGGIGAMKVVGVPKGAAAFSSEALPTAEAAAPEAAPAAKSGLAGIIQKFEQQWGIPVEKWGSALSRDQLLEFKAAKDMELGVTEKALAKQAPKTSRVFKETTPEPEEMTPVNEDVPLDPSKMKSPGIAAMRAKKVGTPPPVITPEGAEMPVSRPTPAEEPVDVMGQTFAEAKAKAPGKATKKVKEKAIQAAVDTTTGPDVGLPTTSGQAVIREGKKITSDDAKELAFRLYEGKFGKPRVEWTPDELETARQYVPEMERQMQYGTTIGKSSPRFWNKQDIEGYVNAKNRPPLDELLNPPKKPWEVQAEAYIGKPMDKWTGADQLKWTLKQLEMEGK